ncbi:MAG: AAA family ATPase [Pseudomonadota bacterium]
MDRSLWLDDVAAENPPELLWQDSERKFSRVWRDDAEGVRQPFIAVCAVAEHSAPSTSRRFVHEHALKDYIDGTWALRPRELVRAGGNTCLLLDYRAGEPLDSMIGTRMGCGRFLRLAVALAGALARLHEHGLVHKDIKPANILVDLATDRVWLTGFGVATRLPRERQVPEPVELIAGTFSHMAPEQTGRMNRSIDARSDLYSLGVTLYQALTASLPFTASDPMEWVHCHIARYPASPRERFSEIPPSISAIVMKLLAKTPEERYQTASGVQHDLERCLTVWEGRGVIEDFALGQNDQPDRLRMPERLYGREREIAELLGAFDQVVSSGRRGFVLVRGAPGIGKSSVVHELHRAQVLPRGLFASGKFDELKGNVPYATLVQAFQSLIRRLLSKPEVELRKWRDDLQQALEPNGALLAELIPELRFIIGEQPPVPEVPASAARARLQLALRSLIGVFARAEHPLSLFFDDLQWLDAATLDLLEHLLVDSDLQHLLLVAAYRDTEVNQTHPLMRKLSAIRAAGVDVRTIALEPLQVQSIGQLIVDALHCENHDAMPLARLVQDKTAGNPFFVNQFMHVLADDGLLSFVPSRARWVWDLRAIQAMGFTQNVVELMVGKLRRLSLTTQNALRDFACLGTSAEISTLACILATSPEEVHSRLWQALVLELIVRAENSYRFVHDRVHEAAYALIPEADRAQAHLTIGRRLAAQFRHGEREEVIFEVTGQLNRGASLITSEDEREQLAELNLIAGKRAKTAAAYASALSYLTTAASLLTETWRGRRDLLFELSFDRAECEFLTGAFATAEARLIALTSRAESSVERAAVACLLADVYVALQRIDRCVVVCFEYLASAGLEIPTQPSAAQTRAAYDAIWAELGERPIEALAELPLSTDPVSRATLDVLAKMARCVQTEVDMNLQCVILCAAVKLSLERGHSDSSCYAYAFFGLIAGSRFGDFEAGLRFGRLGLALVESKGLRRFEAIVCSALAIITPWAAPVRGCYELCRRALDVGDKVGDPVSAVSGSCCLVSDLLIAGEPLAEVEAETEAALAYCRRVAFRDFIDAADTQAAFIRSLRGLHAAIRIARRRPFRRAPTTKPFRESAARARVRVLVLDSRAAGSRLRR